MHITNHTCHLKHKYLEKNLNWQHQTFSIHTHTYIHNCKNFVNMEDSVTDCFYISHWIDYLSGVNFHALSSFCVSSRRALVARSSCLRRWSNRFTAGSSRAERSAAAPGACAAFNSATWFCRGRESYRRNSHFSRITIMTRTTEHSPV